RRNPPHPGAPAAFAAAPRGLDRPGGGENAAARRRRRLRVVLPELLDPHPSRGGERAGHRRRPAAALRGVLRRRPPLPVVRPRASGQGMSRLRFEQAARFLFEAHERREPFRPLPAELAPHSVEAAYAIQDAFVALRAERRGAIAGYKIALTSAQMRRLVGIEHPQAGILLESTVRRTPAAARAADYLRL